MPAIRRVRQRAAAPLILAIAASLNAAALSAQERQTATRPAPALPRATPSSRAPLIGTLGPDAERALAGKSSSGAPEGLLRGDGRHPSRGELPGAVYIPLRVQDAPVYTRGGTTRSVQPVSPEVVTAPAFYPTMQKPVWRVVPEEHPVQGWRVVDVDDTVCDAGGRCFSVTTRMLARWAPALRAYAFRDRVGRVWMVE